MKLLKLSYLLILIVLALFLSGASEKQLAPKEAPQRTPAPENKNPETSKQARNRDQKENSTPKISATPDQPNTQDISYQRQYEKRQIEIQAQIAYFTKLLVIVGGIVGLLQIAVLVLTVFVTNKAANAATKSADVAITSLHNLQRAYLEIDLSEKFIPKTDELLTIQCQLKNYGSSRARVVKTWLGISPDIEQPRPRQPNSSDEKATSTIIPGMGRRIYFVGFEESDRLTDERIKLIKEEKTTLVVFGHFIYSDIFGNEHFTRFFRIYDPRTQYWVLPENDNPDYNDSD